jgi:hypothetical protein
LGTEMGLNGNGAVLLPFIGAGVSLQVLWREFVDNLQTIQVWGKRPWKHRFYDALHNHVNLDARKVLFQRLAAEIDGDRTLSFNLAAAMATKTQMDTRTVLVKQLTSAKDTLSPLFNNQLIQPLSKYVDEVIKQRMCAV